MTQTSHSQFGLSTEKFFLNCCHIYVKENIKCLPIISEVHFHVTCMYIVLKNNTYIGRYVGFRSTDSVKFKGTTDKRGQETGRPDVFVKKSPKRGPVLFCQNSCIALTEEQSPTMWATSEIFRKLSKVNNHPLG
jgi:hypothetical protein